MTGSDSGSGAAGIHSVSDAHLAAVLSDPTARRFFEPFVARTISVKAAADEVSCTLEQMLYRVRVFVKAGLLAVVNEQRRQGRAIKLYRTRYDAYFIPGALTPFATTEERLCSLAEPPIRSWARSTARRLDARGIGGTRLFRDDFGQVWSESAAKVTSLSGLDARILGDPQRRPGFDVTTSLALDQAQARALQSQLTALLEQWRPYTASGSGTSYNLSLYFFDQPDELS